MASDEVWKEFCNGASGNVHGWQYCPSCTEGSRLEYQLHLRRNHGYIDTMFGSGANGAQDANSQKRFEELKQKYQPVLRSIEQQQVQLQNLHVANNKLVIRGTAPTDQAKNKIWDEIKLVNPNADDITADFAVAQNATQAAAAGASVSGSASSQRGQSYTVKPGDSLSKISQQFYGDAHEYMRIFYANKDKMSDPNKIQPGMNLTIPASEHKS